jgi:hypothetical protein
MASVMSSEVAGYNSGKALSQYDIKNLMGGSNDGATEIGARVFGEAGKQEIDHSKGGNTIKMHEQYGGKRSRKARKGSKGSKGRKGSKGSEGRKSPVSGGKRRKSRRGKTSKRGTRGKK